MITVVMREKTLTCTTTSQLFQYDNNIDQIKCIIPCTYDGICLKNVTVILFYKDENGYGGKLELTKLDEMFNNDYYQFENRINSCITSHVGRISIWIKLYDDELDLQFETNETSFMILPSKEIPKPLNAQQQSFNDQMIMKVNQTLNTAKKILIDATNQANIARSEAERSEQNAKLVMNILNKVNGGGIDGN